MRIRLAVLIIILTQQIQLFAQELPVYQQYLLNRNLINPAITGFTGCASFQLSDRHQWIGISDAPNTQSISAQKGFLSNDNKIHGIGLNLYHDINGAYQQLGGDFLYAYHFTISRQNNINLSLGLSVSVFQKLINESDFTPVYDPIINGTRNNEILPEAGVGILLHNENFFAGLSGIKLLSFIETIQEMERHFYLYSGLAFNNARSTIIYEPSILLKITESLKKQIDINFKTIFNDKYWLTFSYRNNISKIPWQSISIISIFGINSGNFSFAYVFDAGLSRIQLYNYGSHEFMIRYEICPSKSRDLDCPTYKGLMKRYRTR